jgi:hypothetical protein
VRAPPVSALVETVAPVVEQPETTTPSPRLTAPSGGLRRMLARLDLLYRGPLSRVELVVFGVLTTILALPVFGPHITRGGFMLDDWGLAADSARFGGILDYTREMFGSDVILNARGRPLNALYFATTQGVFGTNTELHLAFAVLLGVAMSIMLYALLRTLAVERLHAGAIAALVLLFPAADATRLWSTAASEQLAIAIYIGGVLLALRGFRSSGRSAVLFHGGALAAYTTSFLMYEVTAGAILLTGLIYLLKAPWRRVVPRWGADLLLLGSGLLYVRAVKSGGLATVDQQLDNVRLFQREARTLLTHLGITDGQPRLDLKLLALILLAAVLLARFLSQRDPLRPELRRWLGFALAGFVTIAAGYLALLAQTGRSPLDAGFGNRINIAAGVGYTMLIYAVAALVAVMAVRAFAQLRPLPSARTWALGLTLAGAGLVGAVWAKDVRQDADAWDQAHRVQERVLSTLRASPRPSPGSTIYTFGVPGEVAPGVSTFTTSFDLIGAVRLLWDDHTLFANPSPSLKKGFYENPGDEWGIECTPSSIVPRGGEDERPPSRYGKAVFVDVPAGRSIVVRSRSQCRAWASRYGLLRS